MPASAVPHEVLGRGAAVSTRAREALRGVCAGLPAGLSEPQIWVEVVPEELDRHGRTLDAGEAASRMFASGHAAAPSECLPSGSRREGSSANTGPLAEIAGEPGASLEGLTPKGNAVEFGNFGFWRAAVDGG